MNHYCTRRGFLTLGCRHAPVRCLACPFHDGVLALLPDRRDPDARGGLPGPDQAGLGGPHRGYLYRRRVRLAHRAPAARDAAVVPEPRWDPDGAEDEDNAEGLTWTAADDAVARHPAGRGKAADPHVAPK